MSAQSITNRWPGLSKYVFIAGIGFKNGKVYPLEMLLPAVVVILRMWVFTLVFHAAFASKGVASINGYSATMSVWMVMFAQCIQQAGKGRAALVITGEVQSGSFATSSNKPFSYILYHLWNFIGNIMPSLLVSMAIGILAALLLVGPIPVTLLGLAAFGPALLCALVLNFLIYFCVGLTSLWLEDSTPIMWIVSKTGLVFGGLLVPIALLPDLPRKIAEVLPFAQLFTAPAQLIVHFQPQLLVRTILLQGLWLLLLALLASWFFRKGRRHVASNGG
jgi:ABC-2 type transport system permease protein